MSHFAYSLLISVGGAMQKNAPLLCCVVLAGSPYLTGSAKALLPQPVEAVRLFGYVFILSRLFLLCLTGSILHWGMVLGFVFCVSSLESLLSPPFLSPCSVSSSSVACPLRIPSFPSPLPLRPLCVINFLLVHVGLGFSLTNCIHLCLCLPFLLLSLY